MAFLAAALLAGCAATTGGRVSGAPARAGAPVALTFPYLHAGDPRTSAVRSLAAHQADAYVRVAIIDPGGGLYGENEPAGVVVQASGTLVDTAGHLVTSAHIAKDLKFRAEVTTMDGRIRPARVLHVDPSRDLALLRIAPFPGLRPARLADSDAIRRGDPVISIGSPAGRAGVVTAGRVWTPKYRHRIRYSQDSPWSFADGIVLRMPVESRFSGGPVFDREGRLVGVIAGHEIGDTTRAYAIPSNAIAAYLAERKRAR